jgi:outer membrane receptor protein involved in Fe transport
MNRYADKLRWKSALAATAAVSLLFTAPLYAQDEDADETAAEEATDLGKLQITGSRIRRLEVEGPSPIVVVTRDEIEERGFSTVFEALENLTQNTGTVQNESFTNNFTANAQSLSLRSLGGGRTLVLMNGRRVADYPQPYQGQSNFYNFAQIPAAAIERIEVLTGSASAVYGSDAVAGVINVILRDDITAPTISARLGTTADGGGDSTKVTAVWGKQWDRASLTIAAEHQDIDPIFGKDRDYLDDRADNPLANRPLQFSNIVYGGFIGPASGDFFYDPGEQACLDMQDGGVPYEYTNYGPYGSYCGRDDYGDETIQNKRDRNSVYVNFKADISDSTSFYADAMYWEQSAYNQGFHMFWAGTVWDQNLVSAAGPTGDLVNIQRIFHPNETGDQTNIYEESAANASMGLEGSFSNFWNWEAGVNYSTNDYHDRAWRFKEEVADVYFAGAEEIDVCIPLFGGPCGAFYPDYNTAGFNNYDVLSQSDYEAVIGRAKTDSDASVWSVFAEFDGDLMEMKHGPLQFAAIVEFASQEYLITPDERLLNQEGAGWWGLSGTGGGGKRDRSGVGVEFGVPLSEKLRATVATRYDNYNDKSNVGGASTYGIGLEYRPTDSLLLRASNNTSFRAPDMHFLFAEESGYFTSARDIYQCRQDAIDNGYEYDENGCPTSNFAGIREGNLGLEEEEGESLTLGFVFSPTNNFSVQFDYYELELTGAVRDLSISQLLRDEADCRIGVDTNGGTVDTGSSLCVDTLSRVAREDDIFDTGDITDIDVVTTGGINASYRRQKGYDAALMYGVDTQSAGDFSFRVDYTHVLKDERQQYDFDPIEKDYRDNLQNFNARSTINMTAAWDYKKFRGVLYGHRVGSRPNWQETGRLAPWFVYNASATMRFMDDKLIASVAMNNLLNTRPPKDEGFTSWPFFYRGSYNAKGRETFLQLSYTFE